MDTGHRLLPPLVLLSLLAAFGCTETGSANRSAPTATPATSTPTPPAATTPTPVPDPPHQVSLPALMNKEYDGGDLRVGRVLVRNSAYTRHFVTYKSAGLTISGIMNVPSGKGPFPVLVLNHGYIDPDVYTNGRGLAREQDYLARRGYVVLHTDYRNHAQSDDDPRNELRLRLGYTEDVVNAVLAIKRSSLRYLDRERVGLLGRSMGGGVTFNALVVEPDLVDAAVVFAPVSSDAVDNFNKWTRGQSQQRRLTNRIIAEYGSPERNPAFWRNMSAVNFFDQVSVPVLVHHGTADESCPIAWSHKSVAALRGAHKDAQLFTYAGEPHAFGAAWPMSMRRTIAFLDKHLSA